MINQSSSRKVQTKSQKMTITQSEPRQNKKNQSNNEQSNISTLLSLQILENFDELIIELLQKVQATAGKESSKENIFSKIKYQLQNIYDSAEKVSLAQLININYTNYLSYAEKLVKSINHKRIKINEPQRHINQIVKGIQRQVSRVQELIFTKIIDCDMKYTSSVDLFKKESSGQWVDI